MVNNISPFSNSRESSAAGARGDRIKPQHSPNNDNFRKSMRDRPKKDPQEYATPDEPPSLFDLAKSNKTKNKSYIANKSSLKDSNSSETNDLFISKPLKESMQDYSEDDQSPLTESLYGSLDTSDEEFFKSENSQLFASEKNSEDSQLFTSEQHPKDSQLYPSEQKKEVFDENQPQLPVHPHTDSEKLAKMKAALPHDQKEKVEKLTSKEDRFDANPVEQSPKKQKASKNKASQSTGTIELKEDGARAVNAHIQAPNFHTEKSEDTQQPIRSTTIRELATQIIDRIQVMQKDNETQTMITLRHPPILEGAMITLTTSDHAKREFNIAFTNLSPEAKLFLDRKLQEDSLTDNLERKGIVVHMLTTSTQQENSLIVDSSQQASRDQQEQQQQQQQRQKKQNFQQNREEEEFD